MVRAVKGCLLQCDEAVKQIILDLDKTSFRFIINDLDETRLFVDSSFIDAIKEKLDAILEENTYKILE